MLVLLFLAFAVWACYGFWRYLKNRRDDGGNGWWRPPPPKPAPKGPPLPPHWDPPDYIPEWVLEQIGPVLVKSRAADSKDDDVEPGTLHRVTGYRVDDS